MTVVLVPSGSAVTGVTLAEIRSRLQALGYATDTSTAQTALINQAYRRVATTRRWVFLDAQATIATNTSTDQYSLSDLTYGITDLQHINAIRSEKGTDYYDFDFMPPDDFRDLQHAFRDAGVPRYWTRIGDYIKVWPQPDAVYTLTVDYTKEITDLVNDDDVTLIPDGYVDVLVWGTIISMAYRERDWDGHNFARQMYAEKLGELESEWGMTDRQTPKQIGESGYYDQYDPELLSWLG